MLAKTRWVMITEWLLVRLELKPADLWIGTYYNWTGNRLDIWICIIPTIPIHIEYRKL